MPVTDDPAYAVDDQSWTDAPVITGYFGDPVYQRHERSEVLGLPAIRVISPGGPGAWHLESQRQGWTWCGLEVATGPEVGHPDRQPTFWCDRCGGQKTS